MDAAAVVGVAVAGAASGVVGAAAVVGVAVVGAGVAGAASGVVGADAVVGVAVVGVGVVGVGVVGVGVVGVGVVGAAVVGGAGGEGASAPGGSVGVVVVAGDAGGDGAGGSSARAVPARRSSRQAQRVNMDGPVPCSTGPGRAEVGVVRFALASAVMLASLGAGLLVAGRWAMVDDVCRRVERAGDIAARLGAVGDCQLDLAATVAHVDDDAFVFRLQGARAAGALVVRSSPGPDGAPVHREARLIVGDKHLPVALDAP